MRDAIIVVGLGFGDEGKGGVVDKVCRPESSLGASGADLVVRYNGGCQAAHNVVTDDGKHHTFAQFGSGTLAGARTHLSRFMLVDPMAFGIEAKRLADNHGIPNPYALVSVERDALVTTPFHRGANRLIEEARGARRHGSCGMGIGLTRQFAQERPDDALYVRDLLDKDTLARKLDIIREAMRAAVAVVDPSWADNATESASYSIHALAWTGMVRELQAELRHFAQALDVVDEKWLPGVLASTRGLVVFEGAQGVLLDERRGFHPHNTWTDTTTANAWKLLADTQTHAHVWGVTRPFHTRHGAGPFPTEDAKFTALVADDHNQYGPWQGAFRAGALDMVLLRYALDMCSVDGLFVTHLDTVEKFPEPELPVCISYERARNDLTDAYDHGVFLSPPDLSKAATGEFEAQARVGEVLGSNVKPVYAHTTLRGHDLAVLIAEVASLGRGEKKPIVGLSKGPAAKHKVWL